MFIVQGKQDMDWAVKVYKFPHWQSSCMCGWCAANRTDRPWNEFRPHAPWKALCYDLEQWKQNAISDVVSSASLA